jgi:hypothetical protein
MCRLFGRAPISNEGDTPTPQWAADPTAKHDYRYWDGSEWTEHVSDGDAPPPGVPTTLSPPRPAPPAEPNPARAQARHRRRRSIRRAFWLGMFLGAALVGAGLAVAVLVFHVSANATHATKSTSARTTTTSQAVTTTTVKPGRPPQQVRVEVLNGSGVANAAGTKAFALGALGYQIAGAGNAPSRHGTGVECNAGFELEGATLARNLGAGSSVEPLANPPPTGSTKADCVVILGTA